jgi:hypothetical protein
MKWEIKNGIVKDEQGETVCLLSENATAYHIALIKNASDMFDAIVNHNRSIENTRLPRNPKKQYEDFKKLEEKIKDDMQL